MRDIEIEGFSTLIYKHLQQNLLNKLLRIITQKEKLSKVEELSE